MLTNSVDALPEPDGDGVVMVLENLGWETLSPDRLLAGWLSGRSMGLIADRLEHSGALSVIASSVPGIKDVLLLGHLRSTVESGRWERIIVDGPASGRARELLRAPRQVAEAATEGPIFDQGTRANALLTDGKSTAVLLVTVPEETPVNETIETAFDIEDDPGVRLAGVAVNRVFPAVEPPKGFDGHPLGPMLLDRHKSNVEQIGRLKSELPVDQLITKEIPYGVVHPEHIEQLLGRSGLADYSESEIIPIVPASDHAAIAAALECDVVVTVGTGGVEIGRAHV